MRGVNTVRPVVLSRWPQASVTRKPIHAHLDWSAAYEGVSNVLSSLNWQGTCSVFHVGRW